MLALLDSLFGLPAHPLLVHVPVVLVPVSALAVIAIALRPRWLATAGPAVLGLAVVTLFTVQLAMSSGESLQERVGDRVLVERHAQLAEPMRPFALGVVLVAGALVYLDRRRRSASEGWHRPASAALATLALAIGSLSIVQVARVGHSGAKAVWHATSTSPRADHDE